MKAGFLLKAFAAAVIFGLLAAAVANWNSVRIRYHVMRLQDARRPIGPMNESRYKYSLHWARWLAEGRPDRATQQASTWKHEEALIKLGYCERRVYTLTNGTMIDLSKRFTGHRFKDGLITMGAVGRTSTDAANGLDRMVVFATKEDFSFLEEKIKELTEEK